MPRLVNAKDVVEEKASHKKVEHTKEEHRRVERTKARVKEGAKARKAKYNHDMMRRTREQWTNGHHSLCVSGTTPATNVHVAVAKTPGTGNGTMTMLHDTSTIAQPGAA